MVKKQEIDGRELWQCEECGFHYETRDLAEKCEAWCKEHRSCSMEITKHAVELGKQESEGCC
ncbi:hypothetical protein D6817_05490 [Candidatus Pacearchaeota archaeon]|nr:MAG: hypothetical protein D6817_05490 [Candidatus Pacearchaeota archaeon]